MKKVRLQDDELSSKDNNPLEIDTSGQKDTEHIEISSAVRRSSLANKGQTNRYRDYDVFACEAVTTKLLEELRRRVQTDYPFALLSDFLHDLPSLSQTLKHEDSGEWIKAMKKEGTQLEKHRTWTLLPRESIPDNETVLDSI